MVRPRGGFRRAANGGGQRLARRQMLPRKQALGRLPRLEGLPRCGRLTQKYEPHPNRGTVCLNERGFNTLANDRIAVYHLTPSHFPYMVFVKRRTGVDPPTQATAIGTRRETSSDSLVREAHCSLILAGSRKEVGHNFIPLFYLIPDSPISVSAGSKHD